MFYYNQTQLLKDLGPGFEMEVNLHYPGQFLLEFTESEIYIIEGENVELRWLIKHIEYLSRRNKRNRHCMTQWRTFDDMVWKKHIRRNKCRAPYDRPYGSFEKCANKEDIQRAIFDFYVVASMYYPKACQRISKFDVDSEIYSGTEGYLTIIFEYPAEAKIITQSKEMDGHALIGNIGAYIGLFLGNQLLLSTIIIFRFF